MVPNRERSAFAETLYRALQASGHKYIGKVVITDEEYESYRGLSTEALARTYMVNHRLAEKAKVMNLLSYIYTENIKGNYSLSMVTMCEEFDLYSVPYMFYFKHYCKYVKITGEAANTRYQWTGAKDIPKPTFSIAEEIFDEITAMNKFKLLDIHKDQADEQGWQTLPDYPLGIRYKAKIYLQKKTARENKAKKPVTFSRELGRTKVEKFEDLPEVKEPITAKINGSRMIPSEVSYLEPVIHPDRRDLEQLDKEPRWDKQEKRKEEPTASPNTEGTIFILNQRMELYKSIIENWESYCKKLEDELLTLKSQLNK